LLRSDTKGYGGKTHSTDSQNSDTTEPSWRELYHSQFLAANPETFGYTLVFGRKRQILAGKWRILYNELHNLHFSQNFSRLIWVGDRVERMWHEKCIQNLCQETWR